MNDNGKPRIAQFTLELNLVEGKHFGPMTADATNQQILDEAKSYLYPFLKDQIAGGEIDDWAQWKLLVTEDES